MIIRIQYHKKQLLVLVASFSLLLIGDKGSSVIVRDIYYVFAQLGVEDPCIG